MTRNVFIFLGTFVLGALAALVTRAAMFKPYAGHEGHPPAKEYAGMVTNTLSPARTSASNEAAPAGSPNAGQPDADHSQHAPAAAAAPAKTEHSGHDATTETTTSDAPVNTVCAICGMKVNPSVPTAEYQGKKIGFGCRMCPPKFKADPDKYGPYYLRNETIKR